VALVVHRQRQRTTAAASGPRTVADLVKLRAEAGDPALGPATGAAQARPESSQPVPAEPAASPAAEEPRAPAVVAAPSPAPAPEPAPSADDTPEKGAAPVERAQVEPSADPEPGEETRAEEVPAEKPRAPGPDAAGVDAPWHRAALMAAGDGGAGTWEPPAPVPPVAPAPVLPPAAEANPVPVALRLVPPLDSGAADADPEPDPTWSGWADWDALDAEEAAAEGPRPSPEEPAGADAAPPPKPVPAEEPPPTLDPVPTPAPIPTPHTESETEPVALPLGRRTPEERAAEQAAADMALLRTFGYGDPSTRPESAPVVSMVRPDAEDVATADKGAAQPVRFRVVRRDGVTVGGAAVTLLDDRGLHAADVTADAAGSGEVLAPAEGSFMLVATAPGHQPGAVAVMVGDAPVDADVLLVRSSSVSGAVQGEDGPIVGARVTLVQDGEVVDAVTTDAEGAYRIADIGSGEYGLSVAAAGFVPSAGLVEVPDETDLRHDAVLASASPTVARYDEYDDAGDGMMTGPRFS
jgi:Carboxypeptidase regulatory-like domain